jgi:hypothetical protein
MFLVISPVEPFDYSKVSGYFGPGAFGAWVITCLAAFCPAEGRHLLRLILKEPYLIPQGIDSFTRLEYPRHDQKEKHVRGTRRYCENGQPDFIELNSGKMQCLQRFLEYTLRDAMDDSRQPPNALRQFIDGIRFNDREIRALQKERPDKFLLQAKCAEIILDSFPLFFKRGSLMYPGLVLYGIDEDWNGVSGQSCDRLVESLESTYPWFQMSRADFTQCLLLFRNAVRFWSYQTAQSEAEIAKKMDANTWAAIIYPVVACWVCIAKGVTSNLETWRPEDEAAACVAQFAGGVSLIAMLGSRYRIIRGDRIFRLHQRLLAWIVMYLHCGIVLLFRLRHMSQAPFGVALTIFLTGANIYWALLENASHLLLLIFEMVIHVLSPAFERVTHVQLRLFRTPRLISWGYCSECFYADCPKGYHRRLWAHTVFLRSVPSDWPSLLFMMGIFPQFLFALCVRLGDSEDAESYNHTIKINWSTRLGLLTPGSSANISDLDQAAALATALALALAAPLSTLASRARAHYVKQCTYQSTG